MIVFIVKSWLAAPEKLNEFVDLPAGVARAGLKKELCLSAQDAIEMLEEKITVAQRQLKEAQQAIRKAEKTKKGKGNAKKNKD